MTEVFVCDTSVVGHLVRSWTHPERYPRWAGSEFGRLRSRMLAISAVTIAESRAGFRIDSWGERTIRIANGVLQQFIQFPIGRRDLDEWARLRAAAKTRGIAISDNDLWIAATASVREHVLVTCDRDHQRIAAEMPVEVIFLAPPV